MNKNALDPDDFFVEAFAKMAKLWSAGRKWTKVMELTPVISGTERVAW